MAGYLGIQKQISRNNRLSVIYLIGFPLIILGSVYAFFFIFYSNSYEYSGLRAVNENFIVVTPWVIGIILIWFWIAFRFHNKIIDAATGAKALERKENMRVYNLVENLSMSTGMTMPKVQIIEDSALNAFASGLSSKNYTVTLTRGIIEKLSDDELEGVIAHELTHIRNRDVRLLIIAVIFVGILSFVVQALWAILRASGRSGGGKKDGKGIIIIMLIVALLIALVARTLTIGFKFGLSRKREYMADAGAAEMTKNPVALASALRKISFNSELKSVKNEDVKQMFIENRPTKSLGFVSGLFSTHPPIKKRISLLENF